jgi:putative DNA methylase
MAIFAILLVWQDRNIRYANQAQRDCMAELADYLAKRLDTPRPDEASAARILRELVKHQRLG